MRRHPMYLVTDVILIAGLVVLPITCQKGLTASMELANPAASSATTTVWSATNNPH
jgi:hypothetical protein